MQGPAVGSPSGLGRCRGFASVRAIVAPPKAFLRVCTSVLPIIKISYEGENRRELAVAVF
ncbi:MAG: hypothetical protein OM95_07440 [Bdellovibrio sp. ArHS]|nr:MAG: hypothetical protein OM95_07440 [Bdellovibrio sp. ArHS]